MEYIWNSCITDKLMQIQFVGHITIQSPGFNLLFTRKQYGTRIYKRF
jgi:hypothetical protein